MHIIGAPIADQKSESIETSDARREWWFVDLFAQAFAVIRYAETVQSLVEVQDSRGLRYAVTQMNLKARLAQAAVDRISELDAVTAKKSSAA